MISHGIPPGALHDPKKGSFVVGLWIPKVVYAGHANKVQVLSSLQERLHQPISGTFWLVRAHLRDRDSIRATLGAYGGKWEK